MIYQWAQEYLKTKRNIAENKNINLFRGEDLLFDDFILKEGTTIDDIRKADDETLQSLVVNNPNPKKKGTQPAEKINLTREEKIFIKESEKRKLKLRWH